VNEPWQIQLTSNKEDVAITSSSKTLTGIEYRTIDKVIQEDAFKITTDGSHVAGIKLISSNGFREDLSAEIENKSALIFTLKRDYPVKTPVYVSMNCESLSDVKGSCHAEIDITQALNKAPQSQWTDVSIDLKCFVDQGIKFNKIVSPVAVHTKGALSLSVSKIRFEANMASTANVKCE
jgi:beta-glucosidase